MVANIRVYNPENNSSWEKKFEHKEAIHFYNPEHSCFSVIKLEDDVQPIIDLIKNSQRNTVSLFKAAFIPVRIASKADFCKDLFLPTTINHALKVQNIVGKIFAILGSLIFDLLTLPFRLITCIPRILTAPAKENNLFRNYLLSECADQKILEADRVRVKLMWQKNHQEIWIDEPVSFVEMPEYDGSDQYQGGKRPVRSKDSTQSNEGSPLKDTNLITSEEKLDSKQEEQKKAVDALTQKIQEMELKIQNLSTGYTHMPIVDEVYKVGKVVENVVSINGKLADESMVTISESHTKLSFSIKEKNNLHICDSQKLAEEFAEKIYAGVENILKSPKNLPVFFELQNADWVGSEKFGYYSKLYNFKLELGSGPCSVKIYEVIPNSYLHGATIINLKSELIMLKNELKSKEKLSELKKLSQELNAKSKALLSQHTKQGLPGL